MNGWRRVKVIYVKDLIDILRDRRTLIAMLGVPILLYPLLMVGSIQAVSLQAEKLKTEQVKIAVPNAEQAELVNQWIRQDSTIAGYLGQEPDQIEGRIVDLSARGFDPPYDPVIEKLLRGREVHLAVEIELVDPAAPQQLIQYRVRLFYDPDDIRSGNIKERFTKLLERRSAMIAQQRVRQAGLPPIALKPLAIEEQKVTAPGTVLGQILPLILVLMTITGAIYPAIDLTAGERERGTLETLMVCPVPVRELVIGKFLVVTTIALVGAGLNLASVSASVYFGGFKSVIAAHGDQGFPFAIMPVILLTLIPFAIFMSAIMMAVCSFARTFKEAQNYVTPVILAVLLPGGLAALPTAQLQGVMLVMPVGNMVLLTRDLLTGGPLSLSAISWVLVSTSLYAVCAIALAAKVFGAESVVFSDTTSWKATFSRRLLRPSDRPSLSMALLTVAILFPIWFYVQSGLQTGGNLKRVLIGTGLTMPVFFALLPMGLCWYFKVRLKSTFALKSASVRFWLAAVLIGLSAWAAMHELTIFQSRWLPIPEALLEVNQKLGETLAQLPPVMSLLLLAVVPAVCEELLFRGLMLTGLTRRLSPTAAILAVALAFGIFHVYVVRLPTTFLLGVVLGILRWHSGSIFPAMLLHALHNGTAVGLQIWSDLPDKLGLAQEQAAHLPPSVLAVTGLMLIIGLWLIRQPDRKRSGPGL